MSKPRVYEVAKDLNIASKNLIEYLRDYEIQVKNHMSTLEDGDIDIILEVITQQQDEASKVYKKEETKEIKKEHKNEAITPNTHKKSQVKKTASQPKQGKVSGKQIEKTSKLYDTRPNTVDLEKYNNEIIERLVPDQIYTDEPVKRKIKRGGTKIKNDYVVEKDLEKLQEKKKQKPIEIAIPDEITVGELAEKLKKPVAEVIKKLMALGIMAAVNQNIDYDTAALISEDFGATVEKEIILTEEDILFNDIADDPTSLEERPPVVVVMGHVDHGKTSLLDAIREANVTSTEAGGITQHIGAYRVHVKDRKITFLDTPGHEAFTAMRARGAQVTDIAILVVAADDGIMPQTVEAINHAKAANITIIVAINKMDKESANPEKIKQELTEYGLVPEEWGGDTICVPVSALKRQGIDQLLEMVLLVAEMHELKANPNRLAKGTVIEALLDKGRGPVATVLVQNGTLNNGDVIVAGTAVGRVRAMINDQGQKTAKAGPSVPVEILGLSEVPEAGDLFYVVEDEKKAKVVVEKRKEKIKEEQFKNYHKVSLEDLFAQIKEGEMKELNIIIKADVQGSAEAIKQSLEKLSNNEVRVRTIHSGVGAINESDVMLASASSAIIIGFNVRPDVGAKASAERHEVDIRMYRVIYDAIEEVEAAMKGMLDPTYKEVVIGHLEVRAIFKVSGVGTIAGCYVTEGKVNRNADTRVVRDGIVIHEGKLASLKRFKDDVREVASGYECGIMIERFNDIKEGDVIECFIMEEVRE